jgi:hypothetical protein
LTVSQLLAAQQLPDTAIIHDQYPFMPLQRPSRMSIGWPQGTYYEGEVRVPIHLWSRTRAIRLIGDQQEQRASSNCVRGLATKPLLRISFVGPNPKIATGCTFQFVPKFVIRQKSGGSAPVNTPTFNPHLEYTWFDMALENDAVRDQRRSRNPRAQRHGQLLALNVRLGHYSNGQAGCLFNTQVLQQDGTCTGPGGSLGDLNLDNGSFSTNHLDVGGTIALLRYTTEGVEVNRRSLTASYRFHIPGGIGGINPELAAVYGRHVFSGIAEFKTYTKIGTLTLSGQGEVAMRDSARHRQELSAVITWPALFGFGVFARVVGGFDYYNINFGQTLTNERRDGRWTPIFGIAFDHSRATSVTRRGADTLRVRSTIR